MRAITIAAVMAVAVRTISGLVLEQMIPTKILNNRVNTSIIGSPYFCKASEKQPIKQEKAISKTETIIMAGVFTNIVLKLSDFMAHTQTKAVMIS